MYVCLWVGCGWEWEHEMRREGWSVWRFEAREAREGRKAGSDDAGRVCAQSLHSQMNDPSTHTQPHYIILPFAICHLSLPMHVTENERLLHVLFHCTESPSEAEHERR